MFTRELDISEWPGFFDCFSRQYRGRPITLELPEPHTLGKTETIARDLPLVGITAERSRCGHGVASIEILLGAGPEDHFIHTVNQPTHVLVGQITNGTDETIVIKSASDPTVRLDFSERTHPARPDAWSMHSLEEP